MSDNHSKERRSRKCPYAKRQPRKHSHLTVRQQAEHEKRLAAVRERIEREQAQTR